MITYDLGTLADWFSAIGTISAVVVSLYLAWWNSKQKVRITYTISYRSNERKSEDYYKPIFKINVLNDGYKPLHIINRRVYRKGPLFKKLDYQEFRRESDFEKTIENGQLYRFDVDFYTDAIWALLGHGMKRYKKAVVVLEDVRGNKYRKTFDISCMNDKKEMEKLRLK